MTQTVRPFELADATLDLIHAALDEGLVTSAALVDAALRRIEAYDRAGPRLRSVREVDWQALSRAETADEARRRAGRRNGPLAGIPVLLKDNIATDDHLATSAGSVALEGARSDRDAFVARRLREAGALILGKANMTEFANFMAVGMPPGYSSLGGQELNPYCTDRDANGIPLVPPGGSSSGSAVAVAAGLAPLAVGTETSGSLLSPASANALVTVKPTVGLVSRAGIIPIAESQDTAGPLALSVRDAAILLGAMTSVDPDDPATLASRGKSQGDYTVFLDTSRIRGARIGLPRVAGDPARDPYYTKLSAEQAGVMERAVECLKDLGAVIVEAPIPGAVEVGGPASVIDVPVTNPLSPLLGKTSPISTVFLYEFKRGLARYLQDWARAIEPESVADVIAFNAARPDEALRFAQDLLIASERTSGDLADPVYRRARQFDLDSAKGAFDRYIEAHRLDCVLFPANHGAQIAAKAGYPSVSVPGGFAAGLAADGKPTPAYPLGVTFSGPAFGEPTLIALAYAFEQATRARRPPKTTPPL
jgi:amidase